MPATGPRGFTLVELMVVVVLLGTVLLLVPSNLTGFGARSRLDAAANSLAAVLSGAKEQAILDGYEVRVEIGWYRAGDERRQGHRWLFTNIPPAQSAAAVEDEDRARELREMRGKERQWLSTEWRPLDRGIKIAGISEEARRWENLGEEQVYTISFYPDGSVQRAFGVRLESYDLDVPKDRRTMTVLVNGLTAEASVGAGDYELPEKKEASEFR